MMKTRRLRKLQPVSEALHSLIVETGLEHRFTEARAFTVWPEAVGEQIARNAQPVKFLRGRLVVEVTSSTWAFHLQALGDVLIKKVNAGVGQKVVKQVSFRVGDPSNVDVGGGELA